MAVKTKLEMTFLTNGGKNATVAVNDPKDGLTSAEVSSAMDGIIANNIFAFNSGTLRKKVRARINTIELLDIE
jgi:hypothetical protein